MAAEEQPQDPELPQDARLGSLDERLRRAQDQEALRTKKREGDSTYRVGQLVLGHLVGGPAGGFLIGLGLDALFGTRPLFMLLLLFVGFGVGLRNVIRISKTPPRNGPGANA